MIKDFRKENILSTEELIEQIFDGDLERIADWLSTPLDDKSEFWNGLEIQVDCYLSAIKNYGDIVGTMSNDELDALCTLLTNEIYKYHEDHFLEKETEKMNVKKTYDFGNRKVWETTTCNGNKLLIEISKTHHDPNFKRGLMHLWLKEGVVRKFMTTTLHLQTYYYDDHGNCIGRYNPQVKYGTKFNTVNFDYLLEATEENELFLIKEVLRLANQAELENGRKENN